MRITRSKFSKIVKIAATVVVCVAIAGYASYRSLAYVRGPEIRVLQPINGSAVLETTTTIIGTASRVVSLSLNGSPIQIDESGNFKETIIVFPGINVLTFSATDQFKRSTNLEITLLGTKNLPSGRVSTTTKS